MIFNFDERLALSVESSFGVGDGHGHIKTHEYPREGASDLMRLLGQKVISAEADGPGNLTVKFERGDVLCVYNTNQIESYNIRHPKGIIVVGPTGAWPGKILDSGKL